MRGSLRDKQTSVLSATNCFTVEIGDDTTPVINAKARYWLRIAVFVYLTCIRRPR